MLRRVDEMSRFVATLSKFLSTLCGDVTRCVTTSPIALRPCGDHVTMRWGPRLDLRSPRPRAATPCPMPYAIPSTSGYQPTYGPPPVGPPHSLQPLQQYPPQSLGYVAVGASTSTNVQTVSSPSKSFLQQINTLPPLTPQMTTQEQFLSPSSSLNTPKVADVAEET